MTLRGKSKSPARKTAVNDQADKKTVVLQAASRIFMRHGFSAATTDMIQQEAGVSKSTVYAHYPNKEALFIAVVHDKCDRLSEEINQLVFRSGNLQQSLLAIAQTYLEFLLSVDYLALFRISIAEAPHFPQLADKFYKEGPQAFHHLVRRELEMAVKAKQVDVRAVGLDMATSLFTGMVRSEAHLRHLTHPDIRPTATEIRTWARAAVTTFLRAFQQ